jgi:hypothetical protein
MAEKILPSVFIPSARKKALGKVSLPVIMLPSKICRVPSQKTLDKAFAECNLIFAECKNTLQSPDFR